MLKLHRKWQQVNSRASQLANANPEANHLDSTESGFSKKAVRVAQCELVVAAPLDTNRQYGKLGPGNRR